MPPQLQRVGDPRALVETAQAAVEHQHGGPVACDLELDWALRGRNDPGAARERCPATQVGDYQRRDAQRERDRPRFHRAEYAPSRVVW